MYDKQSLVLLKKQQFNNGQWPESPPTHKKLRRTKGEEK